MIKALKLFLLIFLISYSAAICQPTKQDSIAIIKQASIDSRTFKLEKPVWKKYKHSLPETSDYFKPKPGDAKIPAMYNDSLYIKTYRQVAYNRNKGRHNAVLFGADFATVTIIAVIIAGFIYAAPKIQ